MQLFNSQSFAPNLNSTQVNFNRVGLYRLNSVQRNHRPHRPNHVIPTIHWLPVWPKGVIAGVSLISVVTQLNFNRVGLYENERRRRQAIVVIIKDQRRCSRAAVRILTLLLLYTKYCTLKLAK